MLVYLRDRERPTAEINNLPQRTSSPSATNNSDTFSTSTQFPIVETDSPTMASPLRPRQENGSTFLEGEELVFRTQQAREVMAERYPPFNPEAAEVDRALGEPLPGPSRPE